MREQRVEFFSEGERIAALWRTPDAVEAPLRAIVQGPGWLGLKDAKLYVRYHEALVAAGFGVLAFDYRGSGDSGGERELSPRRQLEDLLTNGTLLPAFGTTLKDLAIGYGLAIVVGVLAGIAMGRSPVLERIFDPYINFFQATPLIALVPLIVIWFGVGPTARVAVTFLLAIWSIIINTTTGVKQTPTTLLDVGRIYKLNRLQVIARIQLPNAVPSIFAGLRIALGKALIGVMIAQMEVSISGLGGIVEDYGNAFRTAYLLAGVVTASLVGVVAAVALEVIRKTAFPWTEEQEAGGWKAAI